MTVSRSLLIWSTAVGIVGAIATMLAHGGCPFVLPYKPLVILNPWLREVASMTLGAFFATVMIVLSRVTVNRFQWARTLYLDLRPIAMELSSPAMVLLALLSSVGEELLFRSLLVPWIGVIPQAIIFGFMHQVRGPSRWIWAGWAAVAGAILGTIYSAFGTLSGPIFAHFLINAVNLRFLKTFRLHDE